MSSVGTPELVSNRPQADGRRYVRVMFPCLDHNLGPKERFKGPRLVAANFDVLNWAESFKDNVLEELAIEENEGILDMENISNSLTYALNPKWSTTKRISRVAINHLMIESNLRFAFYLEPLINYIRIDSGWDSAQIANYLDITLAKLLRMNQRFKAVFEDTGTLQDLVTVFDAAGGEF